MVFPEVSGIMFTADPVDGRRHIVSIDAGFGLGEALVSGLVSADLYKIDKRSHTIVEKTIARKALAIVPLPEGGTRQEALPEARQTTPSLSDEQATSLAEIAVAIEAHYDSLRISSGASRRAASISCRAARSRRLPDA
jgi:pyruvate,water dikinase